MAERVEGAQVGSYGTRDRKDNPALAHRMRQKWTWPKFIKHRVMIVSYGSLSDGSDIYHVGGTTVRIKRAEIDNAVEITGRSDDRAEAKRILEEITEMELVDLNDRVRGAA
jgi:hypothetical protein